MAAAVSNPRPSLGADASSDPAALIGKIARTKSKGRIAPALVSMHA
jgi:hypothetical protein